jgi:hypothetical protein
MGDDQLQRGRRTQRDLHTLDRGVGLAKTSRKHLLCAELKFRRQDRMLGVDHSGAKQRRQTSVPGSACTRPYQPTLERR